MRRWPWMTVVAASALAASAPAQVPSQSAALAETTSVRALIAANSRPFQFSRQGLTGPGAEFLWRATAPSQFVLLGEDHHDRDTPIFAEGLFHDLARRQGFAHLVVEQDPVAIATINTPAYRGNLDRIVELVRRYPAHIGFASDQDLALLAAVSATGSSRRPALCGIEQAQGADRYLEELAGLAPNSHVRSEVDRLLALARAATAENPGVFLHDEPRTIEWLNALRRAFVARQGSRADYLLTSLVRSATIYSFNRRAAAEPVGLFNNTERELLFRQNFLRCYREWRRESAPRAVFKMGALHMYRGASPLHAFTIANLAHELAIINGMEAYGIAVIALGGSGRFEDLPPFVRPLLGDAAPAQPMVIDLRPLRPMAERLFVDRVAPDQQWLLRGLVHGYDAIVVLPHSVRATWQLTGFQPR